MIQASIRYSVFAIRLFGIRYLVFEFADIRSIRYSSFFTIRRPLKVTVCIKFQLLVIFTSLFTGSSSLSVFPRGVLYFRRETFPLEVRVGIDIPFMSD